MISSIEMCCQLVSTEPTKCFTERFVILHENRARQCIACICSPSVQFPCNFISLVIGLMTVFALRHAATSDGLVQRNGHSTDSSIFWILWNMSQPCLETYRPLLSEFSFRI
ncbi:hypothetical protein Plhal304r1_c003g0012011 [Plasmopara halstedii]